MLYSFFLIIMKNVGRSSAFRPRYPNIYYRAFSIAPELSYPAQPWYNHSKAEDFTNILHFTDI